MKMGKLAIMAVAVALSGCASPAERQAALSDRCVDLGFAAGTDTHRLCMMQVRADRAAAGRALVRGMEDMHRDVQMDNLRSEMFMQRYRTRY